MSRCPIHSVAEALRFDSTESCRAASVVRGMKTRCVHDWIGSLKVLDRTGLTLPLYARLLETGEIRQFPADFVSSLARRRADNEHRMAGMLERFGEAVRALERAEVRFACLKGFSLIPDYCAELWQRHQVDFDFLIRAGDAARAQAALEQLGYMLTGKAQDGELRMRLPIRRVLGRDAYVYAPQQGGALELHTRFWEPGAAELDLRIPGEALENAERTTLRDVSFPRLSRAYAFLYQVLHFFRHFLGSWARPLWVYEIAGFVTKFRDDDELWQQVFNLVRADSRMGEALALALLTARETFGCRIPEPLDALCAVHELSPIGIWVRHYGSRWLLTDMPGNKLNLLLHGHFISNGRASKRHIMSRLLPRGKRPELCEGLDPAIAKRLGYRAANLRFRASRLFYHLHSGTQLAVAKVRWDLRIRARRSGFSSCVLESGS